MKRVKFNTEKLENVETYINAYKEWVIFNLKQVGSIIVNQRKQSKVNDLPNDAEEQFI